MKTSCFRFKNRSFTPTQGASTMVFKPTNCATFAQVMVHVTIQSNQFSVNLQLTETNRTLFTDHRHVEIFQLFQASGQR